MTKTVCSSGGRSADAEARYEPSEEHRRAFQSYCEEVRKRQISSSENFDKAILTYSSSGLAISLALIKDLIPISVATWPQLLYFSWGLFVLATALTTLSFLVSYKAQEISAGYAERYYLGGDERYFNKRSWCDRCTIFFNRVSGAAFILALVLTALFVGLNLEKASLMSDKNKPIVTQDGMPSALMQRVPVSGTESRGLPAGAMQPVSPQNSQAGQTPSGVNSSPPGNAAGSAGQK